MPKPKNKREIEEKMMVAGLYNFAKMDENDLRWAVEALVLQVTRMEMWIQNLETMIRENKDVPPRKPTFQEYLNARERFFKDPSWRFEFADD